MTGLIEQFGALGVFLLMVPESACIPLPSEITLLFSGFAVGHGWMSLPVAVLAATAGNVLGSLIAYAVGASQLSRRSPRIARLLARWDGLFAAHPQRVVLLARLLPLARTFVSLPAGARRVPLPTFTLLTTIGCAIWAVGLILVGLMAGAAWTSVDAALSKALLIAAALGLTAMATRRLR